MRYGDGMASCAHLDEVLIKPLDACSRDGYGSAGVRGSRPSSWAWATASDRVEAWSLR
jgi:hypothetical protein